MGRRMMPTWVGGAQVQRLVFASFLALAAHAGMARAQDSTGPGFSIVIGAPVTDAPVTEAPAIDAPQVAQPAPAQPPEAVAIAPPSAGAPAAPAPVLSDSLTPNVLENPATVALETDENGITPPDGRLRFDRPGWFWVGQADLTYGREFGGDSYAIGRLAGYAKGMTRSGYVVTASLDTGEDDLDNLIDGLDEKSPRRILDRIAPDDVYPTFGDDSTSYADAPTSGRVYVHVEKDGAMSCGAISATGRKTRISWCAATARFTARRRCGARPRRPRRASHGIWSPATPRSRTG